MKKLQELIDEVEKMGFGLVPRIDDDGAVVFDLQTAPDQPLRPKHLRAVAEVEAFLVGVAWGRARPAAT